MAAPGRRTPSRPKTDLAAFEVLPLASIDDESFVDVCDEIRRRLDPRNDVERDVAELIVHAFLGLRRAARAAEAGHDGAARYLATMLRSFRSRQRSYDLIRQIIDRGPAPSAAAPPASEPSPPAPEAPRDPPTEPESAPGATDDPEPETGPDPVASCHWRDLIAMVPDVEPRWPVVDRLAVVVDDVLSLRDRGHSEAEVLDRFPGLTAEDLIACYACERDGYRGPLEPPYPDDIEVLLDEPDDD